MANPALIQQSPLATGLTLTTLAATLPLGVTVGSALVLTYSGQYVNQIASISGGGVTWAKATDYPDGAYNLESAIWYGLDSSGTAGATTIKVTFTQASGGNPQGGEVSEWSGVAHVVNGASGESRSGSPPPTSPAASATQSGDVVIADVYAHGGSLALTSAGWTALNGDSTHATAYITATGATSYSATWSQAAVDYYVTSAAVLQGAPIAVSVAGSSSFTAHNALSASATVGKLGSATLTAHNALTASAVVVKVGSASLSAHNALAASGVTTHYGAAAFTAHNTLSAAVAGVKLGAANLTARNTLTGAGTVTRVGQASLSAHNTLAASGTVIKAGAATLAAHGVLAATGFIRVNGAASLTGRNTLRATGNITAVGQASFTAHNALGATGMAARFGAATFVARNTLSSRATTAVQLVPLRTAAVRPDTQRIYDQLGPAAQADATQTLLAWLDGVGAMLQPIDDLCRDTSSGPGWSSIVNVDRAPTDALPWLAQFVGTRVDPGAPDAAQRAQIRFEGGFKRGTPAALVATAAPYLVAGATVHLNERDGDPYHLTIVVYTKDLLGGRWADLIAAHPTWDQVNAAYSTWSALEGDSGPALIAALEAAKPVGLVLGVNITGSGSWLSLEANYSTWNAVEAAFPTWAAVESYQPA